MFWFQIYLCNQNSTTYEYTTSLYNLLPSTPTCSTLLENVSQQNHLHCITGLITPLDHPEKLLLTPHLSLCSTCRRPHWQYPSSPPSPWGGGGWRSSAWTACSTGAASGSWSPPSAPPRASLRCGCASPAPPCSPAPLRACRTSGSASGLLWEGRGQRHFRCYPAEVFDWEGKLGEMILSLASLTLQRSTREFPWSASILFSIFTRRSLETR